MIIFIDSSAMDAREIRIFIMFFILGLISKIRRYSSQANLITQAQARALIPRHDPASEEELFAEKNV